jgi:hypothetical protein
MSGRLDPATFGGAPHRRLEAAAWPGASLNGFGGCRIWRRSTRAFWPFVRRRMLDQSPGSEPSIWRGSCRGRRHPPDAQMRNYVPMVLRRGKKPASEGKPFDPAKVDFVSLTPPETGHGSTS